MGREGERERDDLDLDLDAVIPTISRFPNFYVFYLLGCCCCCVTIFSGVSTMHLGPHNE